MAAVRGALTGLQRPRPFFRRPFGRHGIGIALRFVAGGGRALVLRVPAAGPLPDGLRTFPVRLLLQPDGDVLLTLPREALEAGLIDGRSVARLTAGLNSLADRTGRHNPFRSLDAIQAGAEFAATGWLATAVPDLLRGLSGMAAETLARDGAAALAPAVAAAAFAALRPRLVHRLAGMAWRRHGG